MDKDTKNVVLVAGVGFAVWYLFKQVGNMIPDFGHEDEETLEPIKQEAAKITSPWNPNFWKQGPAGTLILTKSAADIYVQAILNSVGFFSDDFSKVYGILKGLKTQSQVSFLCERFRAFEGRDLLTWLPGGTWPNDRFSAAEVKQLIAYVNSLPKYKV